MLKISVMTAADTAFATEMAQAEKWGNVEDDFRRLIAFEPDGCFVAWKDNERIGMVTTTSYDHLAFIGSLIVRWSNRGKGVGQALMRHAIDYLARKNISTVEIDAVFEGVSLYSRLGFRDKYLSLRFRCNSRWGENSPPPCSPEMVHEIIEFDRNCTVLNRERMLRRYFEDLGDLIHVIKNDRVSSYAIIRPRLGGYFDIGPMVAADSSAARKLLGPILETYGPKGLAIGVPAVNTDAVELVVNNGFQYQPPSLRMYLGDRLDYEKNIYGIFSPEKG